MRRSLAGKRDLRGLRLKVGVDREAAFEGLFRDWGGWNVKCLDVCLARAGCSQVEGGAFTGPGGPGLLQTAWGDCACPQSIAATP